LTAACFIWSYMVPKALTQGAVKLRLNSLSCLHPSSLGITSANLVQFPLQGGNLFGVGESNVQARRDRVDEVDVVLFSRRYQGDELNWDKRWDEKNQIDNLWWAKVHRLFWQDGPNFKSPTPFRTQRYKIRWDKISLYSSVRNKMRTERLQTEQLNYQSWEIMIT